MALPLQDEIKTAVLRKSSSGSFQLTLPKDLCLELGLTSANFLSIRAVGPCLVISRARDVSDTESIAREADEALAALVAAARKGGDR